MNKETKKTVANFNAWYGNKHGGVPEKTDVDRLVSLGRQIANAEEKIAQCKDEISAIHDYNTKKDGYMQAIMDQALKQDWTKE